MPLMKEVYLDNAATTQLYPEVIEVIHEELCYNYGNPSSTHRKGQKAKRTLEQSREVIARALGAEPSEIVFTSGGTESNNLAIYGACLARQNKNRSIITSALEHPSVTKTIRGLKRMGWSVDYVDVLNSEFDLEALARALSLDTTLITVMSVQNELGYLFPLERIAQLRDETAPQALLHTDAVQAFGKIDMCPSIWGIDLASFSSHKIGGPKGIGALYVKRDTSLFTTAFGGGQERGLRSGTEAVPLIAGFAKAVELTIGARESNHAHVALLKAHLEHGLRARFGAVKLNSRCDGSPYIVNFTLPGISNRKALKKLSDHGVYVSAASACASNHSTVPPGTWREKHPLVLQLSGVPAKLTTSTFRVSFGWKNTIEDVDCLIELLDDDSLRKT
jgi:cysteine desulfurase